MLHKVIEPGFNVRKTSCRPPMSLRREVHDRDSAEMFVVVRFAELYFTARTPRLVIRKHLRIFLFENLRDSFAHYAHAVHGVHERMHLARKQITYQSSDGVAVDHRSVEE
jgi:hypothetical protein